MPWLRFPRVLGIVVCLYLMGMSAVFAVLSSQNHQFLRGAAETQGTVVALVARAPVGSTRDPRAGARAVSVAPQVRYEVEGTSYTYTAAHGRFRQPLKAGDQITVLYEVGDPTVARLKGEGRVLVPAVTAVFVLAAVGVAVLLVKTRPGVS